MGKRPTNTQRPVTKIQIATLAAKLFVLSPMNRTLELLSRYVLSLARYDLNYDVRDHARMMTSLLAGVFQSIDRDEGGEDRGSVVLRREQVRLVLFQGKQDVVSERLHTGKQKNS
jgi:AP-3 complex subunit beta